MIMLWTMDFHFVFRQLLCYHNRFLVMRNSLDNAKSLLSDTSFLLYARQAHNSSFGSKFDSVLIARFRDAF